MRIKGGSRRQGMEGIKNGENRLVVARARAGAKKN